MRVALFKPNEAVIQSSGVSSVTDMEAFVSWVTSNGGVFPKFHFEADEDGIGGVYAKEAVAAGETLASIPFRLAITEQAAREAFPTLTGYSGRLVTSLFLTYQKAIGDKSFYAPYLKVIPDKIMTTLFFDEEDMRYLENTGLEASTRARKAAVFADYQRLLNDLPSGVSKDQISWEDFLWSYCVLSSRAFPYSLIDPSSQESSEILLPLLDALNHRPNTRITWLRSGDKSNGHISFIAGQPFEAGDQIYNNYGPKSNEELLFGYGFCFEYNEYDHVALKPNFSQDPNRETKLKILEQTQVTSGNDDPLLHYVHRNHIPPTFFKLMRVLVMNNAEVNRFATCVDANMLDFVGYRNELAMLGMTHALLQTRLMKLQNFSLDRNHVKPWQRYALMYRDGQEDVLKSVLRLVDERKQLVLRHMASQQATGRIASNAPFLSILNPGYIFLDQKDLQDNQGPVLLDSVVITLKKLLQGDVAFKSAIKELFEDIEEEEDVIMMLALINELQKGKDGKWHIFFDKSRTDIPRDLDEDTVNGLGELYNSLFPSFTEAFPELFKAEIYTFEALMWAEHILSNYSVDNPFIIVPL